MSSLDVRQAINAAVAAAAAPIEVKDMSDYMSLEEALPNELSEVVLIQYVTSDEVMQSIGGDGNQGWRQDGTVVLHYVVPTGFASTPAVTKGDEIREALRGRRLTDKLVIESCDPFSDFGAGSTGLYGGAWKGWASNLFYSRRDCG